MSSTIFYSPEEEKFNVISHAIGFVLSLLGLGLLIRHALLNGESIHLFCFSIFGSSLVILYAASTAYHSAKHSAKRQTLRILDHAAIYVLIAGSYTPFTLITLEGKTGSMIFISVWSLAFIGIILKIFFTGKYDTASTVMYVLMGWIIILAIKPLINSLHPSGLYWVIGGGIAYTVGAILFSMEKIKFNHAIFHIFVLAGSFCHFVAVYYYVLV